MNESIKKLVNKDVFVILKSGRVYSGRINSIEENMIEMTDKFKKGVLFNSAEISSLEVKEGGMF